MPKRQRKLRGALHIDPANENAYLQSGEVHGSLGDFDIAFKDCGRALQIDKP